MSWLAENWQSLAALAIVALTLAIFLRRLVRPKQSGGCGGGCDCKVKPQAARSDRPGTTAAAERPSLSD